MQVEEWRQFRDTEYLVSSLGRVRGYSGKILKPRVHTNGYLRVNMVLADQRTKDEYVHRMVAIAFIGEPPTLDAHADHIDRDRKNNCLANLRWLSPAENRATRVFAVGERHRQAKLRNQDVIEIRKLYGRRSPEVAAMFGVAPRTIRNIWENVTWRNLPQ